MNWFFGKKKTPKIKSRPPETRKDKLLKLAQSNNYYSVTITCCGCKASSKLIGKSFSFEKAPLLPLTDCSATKCTCEYQGMVNHRHHADRRVKMRRSSIRMDNDRRKSARRKGEKSWLKSDV